MLMMVLAGAGYAQDPCEPYEATETLHYNSFPQLYRGVEITGPGTYEATYLKSDGCDSIIHIIVNRQHVVHEETVTICEGEEYVWRYRHLTTEQMYSETLLAEDGEDSVTYILHLKVRPIPQTRITRTICQGDSYEFGNEILTEAGEYRQTYDVNGCDSIVILSLNVVDVDTIVQVRRIEAGGQYTWPANGETYSTTGTYETVKTNRFECDSVIRLVLTVNKVDTIDTTATICPGETFVWHSIRASQTGHYENVETDAHGDMFYYRADVTVRELQDKAVSFFICGDETVEFNGKTYDKAGHYYDKSACDTLYHIIIRQQPQQIYVTNASLDGTHPYHWTYWQDGVEKDSLFAIPGTYEFSSPDATTGCSNIWRLVLRLDDNEYHFSESVTLCEGEPYSWRGRDNLSAVPGENTYTEHLYTRTGKDSIYELKVTVLPIMRGNATIPFCGSIVWKGTEYSASAIVYDTLTASNGCDSIVTVSLRHVDSFFKRDTATIVQGEQLKWHGLTITTSGVYQDKHENQYGCDSIYELHVGIEAAAPQTNMITTVVDICEGDYYEWRGHKYYNQGNYPDTVPAQSAEEKDTIFVLKLTVTEVERRHEQFTFCEGETMFVYGKNYTNVVRPGVVYRDTVTAPNDAHPGCPDTVYLEIYQYPVVTRTEVQTIFPGETIHWNNQEIKSAGTYMHEREDGVGGCKEIDYLRVVQDMRDTVYICRNDTAEDTHPDKKFPYVWREDTLYTTGLWTDTVFDEEGLMKEFHSLDLHVVVPFDTTVYVHGCVTAYWHDEVYDHDTTFVDRIEVDPEDPMQPCDSVFHVEIIIGKEYNVYVDTTLCEYELPLLLGHQDQDTIWAEGTYQHRDFTARGCDSIITVNLHIIPKLFKNDSTFLCENEIKEHPVWLGDTVTPWFEYREDGRFAGKWQGKWHGVKYTEDTIVWDCNKEYFHHIIVRPSQKVVVDTNYYLCPGDSIRLFWGRGDDTTWFYKDTLYEEHTPLPSTWTDGEHGYTYANDAYSCDSITRWHITVLPRAHKDTTAHRLIGDSIWWGGEWRYYTGTYDSIGPSLTDTSSRGMACEYDYTLHLIMDSAYYFRDTVTICSKADQTHHHIWPETGYDQEFTVSDLDEDKHYVDSLVTYDRRDSIYDLYVHFSRIYETHLYDTICNGSWRYWYEHHPDGTRTTRNIQYTGTYYDTIPGTNLCDSILILHLFVHDPVKTHVTHVNITDKEAPYLWSHTWQKADGSDTTHVDTLRATGEYIYTMPNKYGCDSIDNIDLKIWKNYLFRDTITICADETPYSWIGEDGTVYKNDIYESGEYAHYLRTANNMADSVYKRTITVVPVKRITIQHTMCAGSEYLFAGKVLTEDGTYRDTLQGSNGCDSIVTLILKTQALKSQTDYRSIFEGDSVLFFGQYYKTSGIYSHTEPNGLGCEDEHLLVLTVYKQQNVDTTVYVCENEMPYVWNGVSYANEGDYAVPTAWTDSSRVVTTLHLHTLPVPREDRIVNICKGNTFIYKGRSYKDNTIFNDTIPTIEGCDSIIHYIVRVHPTFDHIDTVHISDKQTYDFHGRILTSSGTYEYAGKTDCECDSMHHLVLIVHPSYFFTDTIDMCQPDTLNWHGLKIMKSGTYTDSLLTAPYGFDSVYQVVVKVHPAYFMREQFEIGVGEVLKIHGRDISNPAVYYDTLRTIHGCDSIFHIVVNPKRTREFTRTDEICQGEYYDFFGRKLTHTGTYTYTSQYKDSIVTLNLTVKPISITEKRILITAMQLPYFYNGHMYEAQGVYTDTLLNSVGCDSLARLVLVVTSHYSDWDPIPLCPGTEVKIDGQTITEAGLYTFERRSRVTGEMDSLYRVEVYDAPAYDLTEERIICDGDTVVYEGKNITRGGHYEFRLKTAAGCDSILNLDVTVNPSYHFYHDVTIPDYETYAWLGKTYMETGEYDRTWPTINDCDSTHTLRLTVLETERVLTEDSICAGQTYTWRGRSLTDDGYYADTIYRPETYQSSIYTLQLSVLHPTLITGATVGEICANDEQLAIDFTYSGARPTQYSIYFDALAKREGFQDVINEPLMNDESRAYAPVPIHSDVVYMDHTSYVKPNRYTMRLVLDNGICGISRSDTLVMLVRYPSWIIEQNWDNIVAPLRKSLNGGYEFVQTDWMINGVLQPNNGLGYLHSDKLRPGDEVVMLATRKGESFALPTCPLTITLPKPDEQPNPILVYPTQAPRHTPIIMIESTLEEDYAIYSSTGLLIESGKLAEEKTTVTLPAVCGMYFIRIKDKTHKVLIY